MTAPTPYTTLKRLAQKALPSTLLLSLENPLRWAYSLPYRGQGHQCPICGTTLRGFIVLERTQLCPRCGSGSRDRRLWLEVERLRKREMITSDAAILDFSPSRCLYRGFHDRFPNYVASDFAGEFIADRHYDITVIPEPDATCDLILCYHILEHIPDDRAAMRELHRVLRPRGRVLIQTPFSEHGMVEDSGVVSPEGRLARFGQEDHVRIYSLDGLVRRLEDAGFRVETSHFEKGDERFGLLERERMVVALKE